MDTIEDRRVKSNLMAATAVFSELVMPNDLIRKILRSDIMQESAFYQDILQEGLQKGIRLNRK